MKLIGLYDSPFVRRVAVTLHAQGFAFEHVALSVFRNADAIKLYNPLLKVPTLVLSDGQTLTESGFILDYLDERVPERRLTPAAGPARVAALQTIATALVCAEAAVGYVYETKLRPEDKHFKTFIDRRHDQVATALALLESKNIQVGVGHKLDQVAITTAVAYRFVTHALPELVGHGRYPHLASLSTHCEELPCFLAAPLG